MFGTRTVWSRRRSQLAFDKDGRRDAVYLGGVDHIE